MIQTFISAPFSQVAFWGLTWGQVITAVFILSAFYVYIELELNNHRKPTIKKKHLRQIEEEDNYYIEIKNTGNAGIFSAQLEVVGDSPKYQGKIYVGYWVMDTRHDRAEIKHDHIDRLRIAHFTEKGSAGKQVYLDYFDTESNKLASLLYEWDKYIQRNTHLPFPLPISEAPTPQYTLRITISSIPDLNGGSFVTEYKIDGEDLYKRNLEKTPAIVRFLNLIANLPATPMMQRSDERENTRPPLNPLGKNPKKL